MKKFISLFLVLLICLSAFSSCTSTRELDWQELSNALGEADERYKYSFLDLIFYNDAYHVFLSLKDKDDVILSLTTDDGLVTSVTATASYKTLSKDGGYNEYLQLCRTISNVFALASDDETESVLKGICVTDTANYFKECYKTYELDHYRYTYSSNNLFISFSCEYFETETISLKS